MTDPTSDLIVMHLWKSLIFQELRNQCETCDWSQKHFPWPASQPGFSSTAALHFSSASFSLRTQAGPPNAVKPGICFLMAVRPAKQWICSSSRCYSGDDCFFFFNMSLSLCDNSERQHRFVSVGASHQPVSQTVGEETGDGRGPDTPRIIFFSFI